MKSGSDIICSLTVSAWTEPKLRPACFECEALHKACIGLSNIAVGIKYDKV